MMKKLFVIILLVVAFCLGTQWGEMKGEYRGGRNFEKGGMMNWGYGKTVSPDLQNATGSVTVEVAKPAVAPKQ